MTSRCSYGCHTGQVQLQRPGRRRSHSADLDQHRHQRCHMGQEIQRKWKLEELEGNRTSDIFSILICFDLFWFVDLKSDEILVIEDDISSWFVSILHPNSWPIAPLQLAIKVFGGWATLLKNMIICSSLGINIPFRWSYLNKSISSGLIQSDQP